MQFDYIIIGGGMVGASMAHALSKMDLKIALIDAAAISQHDPRLIALNYSSVCLFQNLAVWDAMQPYSSAIKQVHVSDRGHFGKVRLNSADMDLPAFGYVVPAKHINHALNATLASNVTVIRPGRLKAITSTPTSTELCVEVDDKLLQLNAKFVIAADGTHSSVRELLQIPTSLTDYHQSAIVTVTELPKPHANIAYERFHSSGALAMLPLPGAYNATIWTDKTERVNELMQQDDAAFLASLQKQFGYHLGRLKKIAERFIYPLKMIRAEQIKHHNVILIGNAAHTLSPIAAQGLNLSLIEVAMLFDVIKQNPLHPEWQIYQAWQQKQQTSSIRLSHQLPWLFSEDVSLVNLARQIGMIGLNICPTIKRQFAWTAMGRAGQLPSLLQGNI